MAKAISKQEDLQDNLRTANYLLSDAKMKASDEWINEQYRICDVALAAAMKAKEAADAEHERAMSRLSQLRRDVEMRERALAEWVNRGTINKAEEIVTRMQELIAQMRKMGMSEEKIREATGG